MFIVVKLFEDRISQGVLGQYAQRHFAQGHYAQGHYAQTEITPKRKLRPNGNYAQGN